jgi:oligogalacturonide transport system substrate-binding protein
LKHSFKATLVVCLLAVLFGSMSSYAAPQKTLRFMWWGGETRHKATIDAIELYMKKNPGVKIIGEYGGFSGYQQKLLTQLVGGTAADIIQIDQPWVADLMSQGDLFADLYRFKELKLNGFNKNFLKSQCEWDKKLVGLPTGMNGLIYVANTDFMAKHKISLNTRWDWDKLVEVGAKVHRQNSNDYLLDMDLTQIQQMIIMHVKQHTGAKYWINADYTPGFDKAGLAAAFAYYQKLQSSGAILPLKDSILFNLKSEQNPRWANGQIGINQIYVSTIAQYYLDGKMKLEAMLPALMRGAKISGITVRPSQLLVINKKSGNAKEAAHFLNWFFNSKEAAVALKTERGIPATTSAIKTLEQNKLLDSNMAKGINLAVKNAGPPENDLSTNKELTTTFEEYIQLVGYNKLSPDEAATQMLRDTRAKLAELKSQR